MAEYTTVLIQIINHLKGVLFNTVQIHQEDNVYTVANAQAKNVLQMMLTKILHLKSIISGINYMSENGAELKDIIDPTALAVLLRNVRETAGMFNLIYRIYPELH
jgi:hypothetical protein